MNHTSSLPILTHGSASLVWDQQGQAWTDLVMGFGAAFLGHGHPEVTAALQAQSARLLICGRNPTVQRETVDQLLGRLLPHGLRATALASSGMEAAELAMRVAATHTGRSEFAGFAQSMHGKSAMTASLCWSNAPLKPERLHTLPFVDTAGEDLVLAAVHERLRSRRIAALFIEPIQGSNGAHQASLAFYAQVMQLCREYATLLVVDEILTGLYRTGPAFFSHALPAAPDLMLFSKNMGNGFPVSCLAAAPWVQVVPAALPGSTFGGNPLALAAVHATLDAMAKLPMEARVQALDTIARARFSPFHGHGLALRGCGALWCIELGEQFDMSKAAAGVAAAGILVSTHGRTMRLLPAATMEPKAWDEACGRIAAACLAARA